MYEEVDVREKGGDNEKPFVSDNHVPKTVNLAPRYTHHCKEDSTKAVCWFFQGGKTTLHNAIIKAE
jgi:hypothetical protein